MVQSNSIRLLQPGIYLTEYLYSAFTVGLLLAVVSLFVFIGGTNRLAAVVEKLVPFMALVYIVFPMKDLCSKIKYLKMIYNIIQSYNNYICIFLCIIRRVDTFKYK